MELQGFFYKPLDEPVSTPWRYGSIEVSFQGIFGEFRPGGNPQSAANICANLAADELARAQFITAPLADLHAHVGMSEDGHVLDEAATRSQLLKHRQTGVLLIRDAGTAAVQPQAVRDDKYLPEVIHCGRHLALPKRYLPRLPLVLERPSELPEAAYQQAKSSDGWVKIVADWIDRSLGAEADLLPLWPEEVLKDAVAAVHEAGARITAHTFSHAAVDALLEAGIDCIEHGSGMDRVQMQEAALRGIPVVPTLLQVELFNEFAQAAGTKYPVYAQTMAQMYQRRHQHFQDFIDIGVQLLPGTDSGGYQQHGCLQKELQLWVDNGMECSMLLDSITDVPHRFLHREPFAAGSRASYLSFIGGPPSSLKALFNPEEIVVYGKNLQV